MVRFRYIECVAIEKKKAEKKFFWKRQGKKAEKMREERKIEKVLRLVIGNTVSNWQSVAFLQAGDQTCCVEQLQTDSSCAKFFIEEAGNYIT